MSSPSTGALAKQPPQYLVEQDSDATWELMQNSVESGTGYKIVKVKVPQSIEQLTPLQMAFVLKSLTQWSGYDLPFLLAVILKCRSLGLDPMRGDVYSVDGRLSTTDEAKIGMINKARADGHVEYVEVSEPTKGTHPIKGTPDTYVDATIKDKREERPQTYRAWYSEWDNPKNLNWKTRPTESLQRKALARIAHRMYPLTEDGDDYREVTVVSPAAQQLQQALTTAVFPKNADVIDVTPTTEKETK